VCMLYHTTCYRVFDYKVSRIASGLSYSINSGIIRGIIPWEDVVDQTEKVRENRLRRKAVRQGLQLVKSRTRDPDALDFRRYMLIDVRPSASTFREVAAGREGQREYTLTLDEIENYLTSARKGRA
jgi:hypothetical protein